MSARTVFEVRVDELVLHGFRPGEQRPITVAVERELARLLAAWPDGAPASVDAAGAGLDLGSFEVPREASPELVGRQIALALDRGLRGASGAAAGGER